MSGRKKFSWLFVFHSYQNVTESFWVSLLGNYFKSFHEIDFSSHVYILAYLEKVVLMFEVFRKMPNLNVTVSLLCSLSRPANVLVYLNKNELLVRRKDLTGTHFRVGYIPNESFFYEEDKVGYH
jgi:hypothetical protein